VSDKDTLRRVREGLDHLKAAIQPFVAQRMEKKHGKRWVMYASRAEGSSPLDNLDLYALLKTLLDQWRDVFDEAFARNDMFRVRNFISTCFEARNNTSHLTLPLTDAEGLRYLDAMVALAEKLKAPQKEVSALKALYEEQRRDGIGPAAPTAPAKAEPAGTLSLGLDMPHQRRELCAPGLKSPSPIPTFLPTATSNPSLPRISRRSILAMLVATMPTPTTSSASPSSRRACSACFARRSCA
jgi:hypothetical protein